MFYFKCTNHTCSNNKRVKCSLNNIAEDGWPICWDCNENLVLTKDSHEEALRKIAQIERLDSAIRDIIDQAELI